MSRYADVDWLKAEFDEANEICFFYLNADTRGAFEELKKIVEQASSIDIVHCGECRHWADNEDYDCEIHSGAWQAGDFCSYGCREERSSE